MGASFSWGGEDIWVVVLAGGEDTWVVVLARGCEDIWVGVLAGGEESLVALVIACGCGRPLYAQHLRAPLMQVLSWLMFRSFHISIHAPRK